ncbi:MAG: sugar transferase [Syntrophobacterales bacterium]|nr:sugar transferase [Syntrophobacterales bacterium]
MAYNRRKQSALTWRVIDLATAYVGLFVAYVVKEYILPGSLRGVSPETDFFAVIMLITAIWLLVPEYMDIPIVLNRPSLSVNVLSIFKFIAVCFLCFSFLLYVFKVQGVSRIFIFLFFIFDAVLMFVVRYIYSSRISESNPLYRLLIIVIGSKTAAEEIIAMIRRELKGIEIFGCLDTDASCVGRCVVDNIKVIGTVEDLESILTHNVVDELLFVVPPQLLPSLDKHMEVAEILGVTIRIIPHWYIRRYIQRKPRYYRMSFEMFGEVPSLILAPSPWTRSLLVMKSVFDFVVALILLILFSPLMVVIGCMIKKISPGPVFYRQTRCGLYGRRFTLYKFRTMVVGADGMLDAVKDLNIANGPVFKSPKDPRIIPKIGHFLRKTGLDELPQLINVLKGDMSLVGPRPPIPEEVEKYDLWQRRRLAMKPGITGLWQIAPDRHHMPFDRWMELDLKYIDTWSLWLDFKILLKTLTIPISRTGM